jgi:hypothetical protein
MTQTLRIMVEITLKQPIKKTLQKDLPGRLACCAYDLIMARGGECGDVVAKILDKPVDSCTDTH